VANVDLWANFPLPSLFLKNNDWVNLKNEWGNNFGWKNFGKKIWTNFGRNGGLVKGSG
jgi:hypothetical protein